jgi:hypothetical protein
MVLETTPRKITMTIQGDVQSCVTSLAAFRQKYAGWLASFECAGPVYRLPAKAIEGLKRPAAQKPPIMSDEDARVETAFSELCQKSKAIGVWNGHFVCPTDWIRPDPLSEDMRRRLNWPQSRFLAAQSLAGKTDSIAVRLRGYVGWLVTEPAFISACDELASRWQALPADERPYPIARSVRLSAPAQGAQRARRARRATESFQEDLNAFLDRWGLMSMLTWDLPVPQGPLLPAPVAADSPAMPKHGLHLVLPIHYPLTSTDDLLTQIRQQQVCLAREQGLDTSMAGLPHHEVYGQMLEVHLLELTIRSRYTKPGRLRGFVTVMERVIAETLKLSRDHVQRLRKAISACRADKRSSVRRLRPRD